MPAPPPQKPKSLTYDDVVKLLDKQTSDLKSDLNSKVAELYGRIEVLENKVNEKDAIITDLQDELNTIKETIKKQDGLINILNANMTEQTDRSTRNTLIIKGVPENPKDKTLTGLI